MALDAAAAGGQATIEPSFRNALPHFLPLAIFPLIIYALIHGGWWIAAPVAFIMIGAQMDMALGLDERNVGSAGTPARRLFWHNVSVWGWAFLWPPTLVFGLWQILVSGDLSLWEGAAMAAVLVLEAQAIFIVGHELVHRRSKWERRLGEFLLASSSYPHYATEHIYIHHAFVGTPLDAGSAPKGMGFWRYFPREVACNLTGAWSVARERLARRRLPAWHWSNPFWRYGAETLFWYALVFWMGGPWAVPAYLALCILPVFSMKISNYLQHYGLRRVRLANGRFETPRPHHSWSVDGRFSNWMFYKMQRHADHHAAPTRQYPLLRYRGADESPQLPYGYSKLFGLVLRPRRWFETMDPLVDEWRAKFYPEIEDWSPYDSPVSAARPNAFDAIVEIFGASPHLAEWIERNPELLDSLEEREFTDLDLPAGFGPGPEAEAIARSGLTRLYWTREFGPSEMKEQIAEIPAQDAGDTVDIVRNWSNDKSFQIGMHTLRGNLTPSEAGTALSNVAEAAVASVLSAVRWDFHADRGRSGTGGVAAIVLGDFASGEVAPGAGLDIVFVHEGGSDGETDVLCRRFRKALAGLSRDSFLFAPVPRRAGREPPAWSLDDLADHRSTAAPDGALPDLTRTRCVFEAGTPGIASRFDEVRRGILARGAAVAELQDGAAGAAEPGLSSLDDMRGGARDVERAARLLRYAHQGSDPAPAAALVFRDAGAERLAEAATLWRDLRGIVKLVGGDGFAVETASARVKAVIAGACGTDDFDALAAAVPGIAAAAAMEIDEIVARNAFAAGSDGT